MGTDATRPAAIRRAAPRRTCSGQAMVEFALGLFVVVLLFSGLFAVSGIMTGALDLQGKMRAEAGEKALVSSIGPESGRGGAWERGPDGKQYTADDRRGGGVSTAMAATSGVFENAADSRCLEYALGHDNLPASMLDFLRGQVDAVTFEKSSGSFETEIPPFAAKYLFGSDTVRTKEDVSMPATGGLL